MSSDSDAALERFKGILLGAIAKARTELGDKLEGFCPPHREGAYRIVLPLQIKYQEDIQTKWYLDNDTVSLISDETARGTTVNLNDGHVERKIATVIIALVRRAK